MGMKDAMLKAGLVTEKEVRKVESEKKERSSKKKSRKTVRDEDEIKPSPNISLEQMMRIGNMVDLMVSSRPPVKIVCHVCHEEGYSVLETVRIHKEMTEEWMKTGKGLNLLLNPREFGLELRKRAEERYGNIITKYGCWKCLKGEEKK